MLVEKVPLGVEYCVEVKLLCAKNNDMTSAIGLLTVLEAFDVCLKSDEFNPWSMFCASGIDRGVPEGPTDPQFVVLLNGIKALTFRNCWNVDAFGDADTNERLGTTKSLAVLLEITGPDRANVELLPQPCGVMPELSALMMSAAYRLVSVTDSVWRLKWLTFSAIA